MPGGSHGLTKPFHPNRVNLDDEKSISEDVQEEYKFMQLTHRLHSSSFLGLVFTIL